MYKVITPDKGASNEGTLSDCLHYIAMRMTTISYWHLVTVKAAIDAGYRIVRA